MKNKKVILVFFLSLCLGSYAQIGGIYDYQFLNRSISARQEALGGHLVPIMDADAELIYQNPSVLDSSIEGTFSSAVQFFPADIQFGMFNYIPKQDKNINYSFGTLYANYGSMREVSPDGEKTGRFYAGEMANYLTLSTLYEGFKLGANLKLVNSFFAEFHAMALAVDVSAAYQLDTNKTQIVASLKNVGYTFLKFSDEAMNMPIDLDLGISRKLDHMPLTVFATAHTLNRWNILFEDDLNNNQIILVNDSTASQSNISITDMAFRHVVLGGEFKFLNKLYFRLAYNYQRRQELKVISKVGTVGFSWGAGIVFKNWNLNYSRSNYHLAFSPNNLAISLRI